MAAVNVRGVSVTINGLDAEPVKLENLRSTLAELPVAHLRVLPTITVGSRPARGGGGSAHAGMPGGPYIRLNSGIWDGWRRRLNQRKNYTLLHETGHIIDWEYDCVSFLAANFPSGYSALLADPHSGATQGPGEHYADAYADYFYHGVSWMELHANARLEALLRSPAFRGVSRSSSSSYHRPGHPSTGRHGSELFGNPRMGGYRTPGIFDDLDLA